MADEEDIDPPEEDARPRRRKSDTLAGAMKERAGKVLLGYGSTGVFSLALLVIGGVYFYNAEKRSQAFIEHQQKQIAEQTGAWAKVVDVLERVERRLTSVEFELRDDRRIKPPPAVPEKRKADVVDLYEEFRQP